MSPCSKHLKTRHQPRLLCFFISDNKMTEWDRMTERDSGPHVCNVLSVVIVRCKLCCLNVVWMQFPRGKLSPGPGSAHTRAAACLLRLYSLVNWNWLQLAVLEHGDKTGRLVATIRQPVYEHLSHWIWFMYVKSESFCCCDFDFLLLAYTQLRGDIADSWLCCIIIC